MGRLRERGPEPNYNETNSDDDGASDASLGSVDETSPQPEAAARLKRGPYAKRPHALGQKRANGDLEGAPAARRRRAGASPAASGSDDSGGEEGDDPIESADEASAAAEAADADFQMEDEEVAAEEEEEEELQQQSAESGWEEEEEEEAEVVPQLRANRARRTAKQGQAEKDEEEDEEGGGRGGRSTRLRGAAMPNYREPRSDEEGEEEEEASSHDEEDEGEEEEEEEQPRRQQAARRPATRHRGARQPEGRRTGRERQRVCYNEDVLLGVMEESSEEEESSSEEEEGSNDENAAQPLRPTRRAAKAAGRAIRQQAGAPKRRKNPKRAAAPASKRRQAVVDSSDEEGSQSGGDSQRESEEEHGSHDASSSGDDSDGAELDYERHKVEKILESRAAGDGSGDEFLCKFEGLSYRKTQWLPYDVLSVDRLQLLRNFQKKKAAGEVDPYGDLVEGVHPDWREVDRVIAHRSRLGRRTFLVKWRGLGYSESTWEPERDLEGEEAHIERYERYSTLPEEGEEPQAMVPTDVPDFCNGRQLRDYQLLSLEWNVRNWIAQRNCILGDEMGLGKTAQSIAVLAYLKQFGNRRGPFLVIAPLTTLGHWQREIETWTDMNCVVYAGGAADREVIQRHDLFFASTDGDGRRRRARAVKPNVVLSSYETVLKDKSLFTAITWQAVIIDEAHRMKSTASSTRAVIASMPHDWLLLLTGTPVQNNMRELFGILSLLDPEEFSDEEAFLDTFGDERTGMTPDQVKALQEVLRPILLRRMKEDVETLPEKEEVIIWVELTPEQRAYYKAIYENQIGTLLAGASSKNMPNLRNLAMELRKVCCHPFLCNGLEEDIQRRKLEAGSEPIPELEQLVQASGKMVLLHKLLPKLRSEGHKVLIFSQFKIMLDVLEDYLKLGGHPFERIDGSTSSRDRQAAIDRFSKEDSESFVFLLSTRAGGQGITLTAADTCIIYDSDWNPQNDLQAMARCHRIGQDKEVTIYRLVSKNTYEENVFQISSRKYGLDEAILGNLGGGGSDATGGGGGGDGNPEEDVRKIADLLKHGAHCLHEMEAANEQGGAFAAEGIDEILQGRTEKRQIGGRAGNTFSVATFAVGASTASGGASGGDDKAYWASLLPEAAQGHQAAEAARCAPVLLAPRRRKQVNYKGQLAGKNDSQDGDYVVAEGGGEAEEDEELFQHKGKKQKKGKADVAAAPSFRRWRNEELAAFEAALLRMGPGRAQDVKREAYLLERSVEECAELEAGMLRALRHVAPLAERLEQEAHAARVQEQRQLLMQQHPAPAANPVGAGAATTAAGGAAAPAPAAPGGAVGETGDAAAAAAAAAPAPAGGGEGAKARPQKRAKDSAVQEALMAWADAEMQQAPPAVATALRSKQFLDWAAIHAAKSAAHLKQREALAAWAASAGGGDLSPGGTKLGPALPHVKVKLPAYWWREEDTRSALRAVHVLGWVQRKGMAQAELLQSALTDPRFGFPERVRVKATPPSPAKQPPQQQQAGAEVGVAGAEQAPQQAQQPAKQPGVPGEPAAMGQPAVAAAAGQPAAAAVHAAPAAAWPKLVSQEEWRSLLKKLPDLINKTLEALAQPQAAPPLPGFGGSKAAAGTQPTGPARDGGGAASQQAGGGKEPLARQAAAGAAGSEPEGISQASDATPQHGGAPAGSHAAATAHTTPLTSQGAGGSGKQPSPDGAGAAKPGSGGKAAAGGPRRAPLPLHASTGKATQQSIRGFLTKWMAPAAAPAPAAVPAAAGDDAGPSQRAASDSPGHRENQQPAGGGSAAGGGPKVEAQQEQEVVIVLD